MAKKVRSVVYRYVTTAGEAGGNHELVNMLRDIIPDEKFEITGWAGYLESQGVTEMSIHITKNVPKPPGPTDGVAPFPYHGYIWGAIERLLNMQHFNVQLTEPIPFDKDDSLNMRFAWSTVGGGLKVAFNITFYYTTG